jgi:predicted transcriptional regulator YdeE
LVFFIADIKERRSMNETTALQLHRMTVDDFAIIGISVRTTNKANQSARDIGKLWQRFYAENLLGKIPDKVSDDIFSIYTDYKSDYTEPYTIILGLQVNTLENIPNGLVGRQFPAENFLTFTAKGPMPQAVIDVWVDIWQRDKELQRRYTYDFEVYGAKSQRGNDSEVDIYVATNRKI